MRLPTYRLDEPGLLAPNETDNESDTARVLRMAHVPDLRKELRLATGHRVRVDEAEPARILVHAPDGVVELSVTMTPDGPLLRFESAALELRSTESVRIDCNELDLRARKRMALHSGGDLEQSGSAVQIAAREGSVNIDAAHDVDVQGAKILLNC